jgi:hypothetical protein
MSNHHQLDQYDKQYSSTVFMVLLGIFILLILAIAYVIHANMWDVPVA